MEEGVAMAEAEEPPTAEELSDSFFEDPNEAAEALPVEEAKAYREAQRSVVNARRDAEQREGFLRIG